ncbi:MAG: thiol-activated cytolysin family protein [Bacteroidota bacterium]
MKKSIYVLVVFSTIQLWLGCQDFPETVEPLVEQGVELIDQDAFNEYIYGTETPDQEMELEVPELIDEETVQIQDTIYCQQRTYTAAPGYDEFLLYNPSSDVIYPGGMLYGESIVDGSYTPFLVQRLPVTLSTSLSGVSGSVSSVVEEPKLSSVREAINELLAQEITGATPAQIIFSIEQIHDENHLRLAVGANVGGLFAKVRASYNFSNSHSKAYFLVKFLQIYYTIDVDNEAFASPSDCCVDYPTSEQIGDYSPVYVSSVKYGRMAMFMVESSKSASETEIALNASFNAFIASGGVDINTEYDQTLEESSIKALIIGGSGESAVQAVSGVNGLMSYITEGGNYSSDSPGSPLSYTLRFLKDNSIYKVVLATEYTVQDCQIIRNDPYEYEVVPVSPDGTSVFGFLPSLVRGDGEYGGNGFPWVNAKVELFVVGQRELWAKVDAIFEEQRHDWTTGRILENVKLFTIPEGLVIEGIVSDKSSEVEYYDQDHSAEMFVLSDSEPVKTFEINGDTGGVDLPGIDFGEGRSWMKICFNPVTLSVKEDL